MLGDHLCLKNDVIVDVDDLYRVSERIDYLVIGNWCLNKKKGKNLTKIDFSRFVNVRTIDVGYGSLNYVESVVISSKIIDNRLIDLIFLISLHSLQEIIHSEKQIV